MKYTKEAKTIEEHRGELIKRGLSVKNVQALDHDLRYIGYFRLSGYMHRYQIFKDKENTHQFIRGTQYKDIQEDYDFDRKLRRLYLEAIEHVEVFMRAIFNDYMSVKYGPYWFLEAHLFENLYSHSKFLCDLHAAAQDNSQKFIRKFKQKYINEEYPPSWMVFELLSFGSLSMLYQNLNAQDREKIATIFSLQPSELKSWLHALSYVRNTCAHHNRLMDKYFTIRIKAGGLEDRLYKNTDGGLVKNSLYSITLAIVFMMHKVNPTPKDPWVGKLIKLFDEYKKIDKSRIGFETGWKSRMKF